MAPQIFVALVRSVQIGSGRGDKNDEDPVDEEPFLCFVVDIGDEIWHAPKSLHTGILSAKRILCCLNITSLSVSLLC